MGQNDSKMASRGAQSGPKMAPRWPYDGPKIAFREPKLVSSTCRCSVMSASSRAAEKMDGRFCTRKECHHPPSLNKRQQIHPWGSPAIHHPSSRIHHPPSSDKLPIRAQQTPDKRWQASNNCTQGYLFRGYATAANPPWNVLERSGSALKQSWEGL